MLCKRRKMFGFLRIRYLSTWSTVSFQRDSTSWSELLSVEGDAGGGTTVIAFVLSDTATTSHGTSLYSSIYHRSV